MIIINQAGDEIVNWDNVTSIRMYTLDGYTKISAILVGGDGTALGTYDTEKEAADILDMIAHAKPSDVLYMPEE